MGINFGRMAQGLATGYLGAAIKDKEAKDNARMEVVKAAGIDFETNIKPAHQKEMKLFEADYNMVAKIHGKEIANLFGDTPGFFGTGKGLDSVNEVLKQQDIDKNDLKNFKFSTFEERNSKRISAFDKKQSAINAITGIGGTGPKVAEMQLEGFGEAKPSDGTTIPAPVDMGTIEKEVEGTSDTTQDTPINQDVSTLFTPKVAERGVESKFENIKKNVVEQYGYGETVQMANGSLEFKMVGSKRNEANAHIALAENFSKNRPDINQIEASALAKQELDSQVLTPFKIIESSMKDMKYFPGDGETGKAILGDINTKIDSTTSKIGDKSIYDFIVDIYDNDLLQDGKGNINKPVFDKFLENLPVNIMYNGEPLKQVLANSHALKYFNKY
jgi:hypothetical protein